MRTFFTILTFFIASVSFAQSQIRTVPLQDGKVVFNQELSLDIDENSSYQILKMWARDNYGKEPFISSVRYDNKGKFITAKSRIELLLPPDSKGVRETIIMRYRADFSISNQKCHVVIRDIAYLYDNPLKPDILPHVSRAEDLITNQAVAIQDSRTELRINIRKSTMYFINQTCLDLNNKLHGK